MKRLFLPAFQLPCLAFALLLCLPAPNVPAAAAKQSPNFVIIFADDLGYGDLGSYGHPTIRTPHLDRMAAEGMKFTQFYSAASVCTPSRAALLTGRLPVRSGMSSDTRRVLFPDSAGGLPPEEITIARALKAKGYATACIGKWHLGHRPEFLPTRHGFDYYFGIPYSNDMDRLASAPAGRAALFAPKSEYWNVPLMRNEEVIERPANQTTVTKRYTEEAVRFIRENKEKPFFLYLPHTMPHVPLFASADFDGRSRRGLYGDTIEEIDHSVGQVLETLRREKLAENTFVFFTSDNGPWLIMNDHGGSAGLLREGKGSTWEGGMRVPGIAWWPGKIKAGSVTHELACTMDLFGTILPLAGAVVPQDRVIDGVDLAPLLLGRVEQVRDLFFYYRGVQLYAVRKGPFKAHYITRSAYGKDPPEKHDPPLLYHLDHDPSEQFNVAGKHPEILAQIAREVEQHRAKLVPGKPQLEHRIDPAKAAAQTPKPAANQPQSLFDGQTLKGWQITDFAGGGEVEVKNKKLVISMGDSLSGINWTNAVPRMNYEISLEAMKLMGSDFFCGLTFPVDKEHCTLIVGGWGGALVGISNVDGEDASENETTQFMKIDKDKWYRIRVRVTPDKIEAWIDDDKMVNLVTTDRKISMRFGDIEMSAPLGLATYQTASAFRNIQLRKLEAK